MYSQLYKAGFEKPGAVVTCVGGGGLLAGIARGMQQTQWGTSVPIVAMETLGAESFNKAVEAGRPVKLDTITSVAKTLGTIMMTLELLKHWVG